MRIALVSLDWRPTGGVATYTRLLSATLAQGGHDVLVLHGEDDVPADMPDRVRLLPASPTLFTMRGDRSAEARARGAVDDFRPDIVHVLSSHNFAFEASLAARRPLVKTLQVHEYCPSGTKFHFGIDRPCAVPTGPLCLPRMGYLRCTLSRRPNVWWRMYARAREANRHHQRLANLIVCSAHLKRQAVFTGFDAARVSVVPYFTVLPPEPPHPEGGRAILFVGRLYREKGVDLLLEALARLQGEWRAVIVGAGLELDPLRRHAAALGLAERVSFPGWLTGDGLDAAYVRASVVVVPSRWPEPFGIVGLEAMARARPVVAFDVGGIPEWLRDGVGGWLVPAGDVAQFAARLQRALDDPLASARVAALGRERVAREFTAAPHLATLSSVYERARAGH